MAKKTETTTTVTLTCDTCGKEIDVNYANQMVLVGMAYPDNVYGTVAIQDIHTAGGYYIKNPDLCADWNLSPILSKASSRSPLKRASTETGIRTLVLRTLFSTSCTLPSSRSSAGLLN